MTTTGTARVASLLPSPSPAPGSWGDYVTGLLDPAWRPAEWNAESGVFTPDPNSPATLVAICTRPGCGRLAHQVSRNPLCGACVSEMTRLHIPKAALLQTPVSRERVDPTQQCLVVVDGDRCAMDGTSRGLCRHHYQAWKRFPDGTPIEAFAAAGVNPSGNPLQTYPRHACSTKRCKRGAYAMKDSAYSFCPACEQRVLPALREGRASSVEDWLERLAEPASSHDLTLNLWTLENCGTTQAELLYVLQQHDKRRAGTLDPVITNAFVRGIRRQGMNTLVGNHETLLEIAGPRGRAISMANFANDVLEQAHRGFTGYDPTIDDLLYLEDLNLRVVQSSPVPVKTVAPLDLTEIPQLWLREAFRTWALTGRDTRNNMVVTFKVMKVASAALSGSRADQGHRPERLGLADMTAVVNYLHSEWTMEGRSAPNYDTLKYVLRHWWNVVDLARRLGLWNDIPADFARDKALHKNRGVVTTDDDELGRALPNDVVKHLRASTHLITGQNAEMRRAASEVLIDTGRRPNEVVSLQRDCLERVSPDSDEWWLLWDNHKTRRASRRLPINSETVEAIRRWQAILDESGSQSQWLFPSPSSVQGKKHLNASTLGVILTNLCAVAPPLTGPVIGVDGEPVTADLTGITPYDFRHSYAQRHADAGVPPDALRELMDHKNFETTMGYYRVSAKRKRAAAKMVAPLARDRSGRKVGISESRQGLSIVAVPFGGCSEPSNVKAAGNDCPVRFQCAGCNFYRPDPSYLPDLERHIADLKMNLAAARKMGSPSYVVANFEGQIADYRNVINQMRDDLDDMPDEQRKEIDAASAILRRSRAAVAAGRALPLTVVQATPVGAQRAQ